MNLDGDNGSGGGLPTLSADEEAFFSSGGEKAVPADGGGDPPASGDGGNPPPAGGAEPPKSGNEPPKNDHVPLATFLEEKRARKEQATKLADAEKQLAELRGKFSIIDKLKLGGADPAEQQPSGPPAVEDDIFGAVKHVTDQLSQMQKAEADAKAKRDADEKAASDHKTFVDNYVKACNEFEKTTPDFKAAYDFLLSTRAAELKAIGYDTPETLHAALQADEMAVAQMAFERGKSPAELIYNLSAQRGYKKAAAAEPGKGAAAEKLDAIERGQAAHKSLSNTGGSSGDPDMTAQALLDMPAEEFEAWCTKNPAKAKRLFGG